MKKVYSKPEIVFESFSMNVNIAVCDFDTNTQSSGVCGISFGDESMILFMTGINQCNIKVEDDGTNANGVCYHNPTDTKRLFNS